MIKNKFNSILSNFLTGVLSLLPFVISYWIIVEIYNISKNSFSYLNSYVNNDTLTIILISIVFFIIINIGNLVKKRTKSFILDIQHKLLTKIPLINKIYVFFKDTIELFTSTDNDKKVKVCFVDFAGQKSLGFINNKNGNVCTVFVPTAPNPTNGFTMFILEEELIILDISKEQALSNIVSLGTQESPELREAIKQLKKQ